MKSIGWRVALWVCCISLSGCFGPEGTVAVKTDINSARLSVDGQFKAVIGKEAVEFSLEVGEHVLSLTALSEDEEWQYNAEKKVVVSEDVTSKVYLDPDRQATQKRIDRLAFEKKQRAAERLGSKAREIWQQRVTQALTGESS